MKHNPIVDEITVCPYCMYPTSEMYRFKGCCGESSSHFEKAYILENGDCILESEYTVNDDKPC